MKNKIVMATAAAMTLAACSGSSTTGSGCNYTPLLGNVGTCDTTAVGGGGTTDNGTGAKAKLLTGDYVASRIEYDANTDEMVIESLPFDDEVFEGRYRRFAKYDTKNFKAYLSSRGKDTYVALYQTSISGGVAAAVVGQDGYADHGHAGVGYARSGEVKNLPSSTQATYNGTYVGLRTFNDSTPFLDIIGGDVLMTADFSDNKVRGLIYNRTFTLQQSKKNLGNSISLVESPILRAQANMENGKLVGKIDSKDIDGSWEGLFGGANGEEITGVVIITEGTSRETGIFVATR